MKHLQELVIELTSRCPMSCQHCSSDSGPERCESLTSEAVTKLLGEAAGLGVRQICFGGGEPVIAPLFMPTLEEALRLGFAVEVFTCGVVLGRGGRATPFQVRLMQSIAALRGKPVMVFSFHGSRPAVHDSITGVSGSFDCLMRSVKACLSRGMRCAANFVPIRPNAADLHNVVRLLEGLGIPRMSILRFVPQGRGLLNRPGLELTREEEDRFVENLLALREEAGVVIRTGSPFNGIVPDNSVPCRAGFRKLVVQADGNVLPCEVFKHHNRRAWGASIHRMTLGTILGLPKFVALQDSLLGGHCGLCPVHGALRQRQPRTRVAHGLSKAAV